MYIRLLSFSSLLVTLIASARARVLWENVCSDSSNKNHDFCNPALSREQRIDDYVRLIPVSQQIKMMVNDASAYETLNIPRYQWWSEGLHGPLQPCVCGDDGRTCKCPTSFPAPTALGSALNHSLWYKIAHTISREARAIANLRPHPSTPDDFAGGWSDYDGLTYWSPTLNLQRDPRWGRNQESPGEDPLIVSNYAREFVKGLQQLDEKDGSIAIAACCKHWVGNSLEGGNGKTSRHNFSANITQEDMTNYYERPFQACVEAKALGVMCSYNAVDGVPSCASGSLLNEKLRKEWHFDGYVVSDCKAIEDIITGHHFVSQNSTAVAMALKAGTDLNCGKMYERHLPQALENGQVSEADIEQSFRRLVNVQMRLGLFDPVKSNPYRSFGIDDIDTEYSRQLSLEAAQQSIVMLKNDGNVLPFSAPVDTLAVIGPHMDASGALLSNYHGQRCPGHFSNMECVKTPLQALVDANIGGATVSSRGCAVTKMDSNGIEEAVEVAKSASAIVLLLGLDQSVEEEGRDRVNTTLPGLQTNLLNQILDLQNPNTVVVLIAGGQVSLGKKTINSIPAILSASYGGQMGAQAIADVVFGSYNPTGTLVATMYPPEYVDKLPITEMRLGIGEGRTHMYYTGLPDYPFGSGLSYSTWDVSWVDSSPLVIKVDGPEVPLALLVRNTDSVRAGRLTALMFWRPVSVDVPVQQALIGYRSTDILRPGESAILMYTLDANKFAIAKSGETKRTTRPGDYELTVTAMGSVVESRHVIIMNPSTTPRVERAK